VGGRPFLYLSRSDIATIALEMGDVVAAVEEGFRLKGSGDVLSPPKPTMDGPDGSFAQVMAAYVRGLGVNGVKWISAVPANISRGLPQMHAAMLLFDEQTGAPVAAMEAGLITEWRTGASVGVAARYLARRESRVVGMLGCGLQSRPAIRALAAVLPMMGELRYFDVSPAAMSRFAGDLAPDLRSVRLVACDAAPEVCSGADVVVTAIRGDPECAPLDHGLLEPGALAVALDWDQAWTAAAMAGCDRFVCDDVHQVTATKAAGSRLQHVPERTDTDLGEVVAGAATGRRDQDERIFCLNMGLAVEDLVVAKLVIENARARGIGIRLPE
jgi:alanine dehydrogenase